MKARASGTSRHQVALIRKTLKANPGCSIVMKRGPDGEADIRLKALPGRAAELARLKRLTKRADLLLLQAHVQESELPQRERELLGR